MCIMAGVLLGSYCLNEAGSYIVAEPLIAVRHFLVWLFPCSRAIVYVDLAKL